MLTTLAVAGYRSLRDVVVPLAPLTVVTGPNGSGKSNLYRSLGLLASVAAGTLLATVAREGGIPSLLWAGPEDGATEGTVRRGPVAVRLGFASEELGYLVDLGLPQVDWRTTRFARDPVVKREQVFAGAVAKPSTLLVDRRNAATRVRDGEWRTVAQQLAPWESAVTDLADAEAPELLSLRRGLAGWRLYDHFRIDPDAPARRPQVGTRTATLAADGANLAALWVSIAEEGAGDSLDAMVDRAFPGSRVEVADVDGRFTVMLRQPGLLRPLGADELSDGTLRFLLLCAALLPARPAPLIVLNEPEASLHVSMLPALAELVTTAAGRGQVLIVSHARELVEALPAETRVELARGAAGTEVVGQEFFDRPSWTWGAR